MSLVSAVYQGERTPINKLAAKDVFLRKGDRKGSGTRKKEMVRSFALVRYDKGRKLLMGDMVDFLRCHGLRIPDDKMAAYGIKSPSRGQRKGYGR